MSHISLNPLTRAGSFTPPTQGLLQRKCGCGNRTAGGGHCEECAKNKNSLQRQMRVGSSNDPLNVIDLRRVKEPSNAFVTGKNY